MADRLDKILSRAELEAELELLRHREILFNESERFIHQGYFEWNVERKQYQSWSPNFTRILNLPAEFEHDPVRLRQQLDTLIHPKDIDRFSCLMDAAADYIQLKIEFRVANGEEGNRFVRQVGVRKTTSAQGETCLMGMIQDVTAQMIDEYDPAYSDSFTLQVERLVDIGSFIYDDYDDVYLYASPGCARIHGVTEAEFIEDVESVEDDLKDVHDDDREMVRQAYSEYFSSAKECSIEYRILRPDGEIRWIRELLSAHQLRPDNRVGLSRGVIQDITRQKDIESELLIAKQNLEMLVAARTEELASTVNKLEEEIAERAKIAAELEFLANHDPLTDLPSLRLCMDRLERALADARRNRKLVAVMFLDLDGFKTINDNFGHDCGDRVLKTTANNIKAEIRETDTVARIGGDEFLVVLTSLPDISIVERIASKVIEQVSQPIMVDQHEIGVGVSIGISIYPQDSADPEELIRVADKAMYFVKNSGKNSFGFTQPNQLN